MGLDKNDEEDRHSAASDLLPLVYDELRLLARSRMNSEGGEQTLQATALVHEAYLRLTKTGEEQRWESKRHFFGAAAEAMRRILVDRARDKGRLKRGGSELKRTQISQSQIASVLPDDELTLVDAALERLEDVDPEGKELVMYRYFVGLTLPEISTLIGVSERTLKRRWAYARAWLKAEIGGELSA